MPKLLIWPIHSKTLVLNKKIKSKILYFELYIITNLKNWIWVGADYTTDVY